MAKRSKEELEEERKRELLRTLRRGPDLDRFIDEKKKEKQRTGKEFRNGFDAGFYIILDRNHEGIENAQFNTRQLSVHSTIIQTVE